MKRNVSGIEPQPSPRTSQSTSQTTIFWKTIGSVHQSPMSPRPPIPGVDAAMIRNAAIEKTTSLRT